MIVTLFFISLAQAPQYLDQLFGFSRIRGLCNIFHEQLFRSYIVAIGKSFLAGFVSLWLRIRIAATNSQLRKCNQYKQTRSKQSLRRSHGLTRAPMLLF